MMVSGLFFLKQESIFKLGYVLFFRQFYCTLNRLQYSVNKIFICIGESKKIHVTHFIVISALSQWSCMGPTISWRCPLIVISLLSR